MVAVVEDKDDINMHDLNKKIRESLPSYSRPVFIRMCKQDVETTGKFIFQFFFCHFFGFNSYFYTGTYKLKKNDLVKSSFSPTKCGADKLFYLDPKTAEYEPLSNREFELIAGGKIQF